MSENKIERFNSVFDYIVRTGRKTPQTLITLNDFDFCHTVLYNSFMFHAYRPEPYRGENDSRQVLAIPLIKHYTMSQSLFPSVGFWIDEALWGQRVQYAVSPFLSEKNKRIFVSLLDVFYAGIKEHEFIQVIKT